MITVTPAWLSSTLYPGGVETQTLTIGNTGQSDLNWSAAAIDTSDSRVVEQSPVFRGTISGSADVKSASESIGVPRPGSAPADVHRQADWTCSDVPSAPGPGARTDLAEILAGLDAGFAP